MKRDYSNPRAGGWFEEIFADPARFPFRFTLDGREYRGFGSPLVPAVPPIRKTARKPNESAGIGRPAACS